MNIEQIIRKYAIEINPADKSTIKCAAAKMTAADIAEIKANKPAIIAELNARETAMATRQAAILASRPIGYDKVIEARRISSQNSREFDRAMERGDCDFSRVGNNPENLEEKYPLAALYVEAEDYQYSSNYMKSACGTEALESIYAGADISEAVSAMKKAWSTAAAEAVWND